jgi:hypothetical protein
MPSKSSANYPVKKDNKGPALAALAVGGAALLLLANKKKPSTAPTAVFMPNSGPVQTEVDVTGINWQPLEEITAVTVGDISAPYTLAVDSEGKLAGTLTIPVVGMSAGIKPVKIEGAETGLKTFAGAFKVTVSIEGWMLMTAMPVTVNIGRAIGAEGWLLMTAVPTSLAIGRAIGAEGWLLMTASPTSLAVGRAVGAEGWLLMTASPTSLAIGRAIGADNWLLMSSPVTLAVGRAVGAEDWLLMSIPISLSIGRVTYYPSLTCTASVPYGGDIDFDFAGFPPNVSVWVGVVGGGGSSYSSNSNGVGSGSIGPLGEAPGSYQLEAYDSFGHRATANFTITQAPSQITNVGCTNFESPVSAGTHTTINVKCDYIGPGEYVTLYAALGNQRPIIGFDELDHTSKSIYLAPAAVKGTQYFTIDIPIAASRGAGVYDIYAKIGGVLGPEYANVVQVTSGGGGTPTLVADAYIYRNGVINFSFSGFTPNSTVMVGIEYGGYAEWTADGNGAGSGGLGPLGEQPGTYTLYAAEDGHYATATFQVWGP